MEPTTQAQFDRTNILMKEFVDTVFSFYNNIKEQNVCQMADEQTLEKIRKQSIPQQGRPVEEVYREMLSGYLSQHVPRAAPAMLCLHPQPRLPLFLDGRCDDQRLRPARRLPGSTPPAQAASSRS